MSRVFASGAPERLLNLRTGSLLTLNTGRIFEIFKTPLHMPCFPGDATRMRSSPFGECAWGYQVAVPHQIHAGPPIRAFVHSRTCIKHYRRFGKISPTVYFSRVFCCAYFGVLGIRASVSMRPYAAQGVTVDTLRERFL